MATAAGGAGHGQGTFVDGRTKIQAFFSIWCPSQLGEQFHPFGLDKKGRSADNTSARVVGTAMTKFSSGPDSFALSQSWGWKSSSLRSAEYVGGREGEDGVQAGDKGEGALFSSLRVAVVMGLV